LTLSIENEKLRNGLGVGDSAAQARIQVLEKKLLDKQEELTEMHKRKSDNQQMIIDLNVKVTDLQKQLETKNNR
jgi:autophagy-related protein 16-1